MPHHDIDPVMQGVLAKAISPAIPPAADPTLARNKPGPGNRLENPPKKQG